MADELSEWNLTSYCTGAKVLLKEVGISGVCFMFVTYNVMITESLLSLIPIAPVIAGSDNKDLVYAGDMNAKVNMGWIRYDHYKDFTLSS